MSPSPNSLRVLTFIVLAIWSATFFAYMGWKPSFAYNAQRYFEIFLLGCLFSVGVALPVRFHLTRVWLCITSLLLFVMLFVLIMADNTWIAVREALQYLILFFAVVVVAKSRQYAGAKSFDRAASLGLVLFNFGCSLIVLEGLVLSLAVNLIDQKVIFGAFVNVRFFAELQMLTLLMLPAARVELKSTRWRVFILATGALGWGLLLFSGTRAALVAVPFAFLVVWITRGGASNLWFRLVLQQLIGGVLIYGAIRLFLSIRTGESLFGEAGLTLARATSGGRLDIWWSSWQMFLEHPVAGNGPGAYACLTTGLVAHPHNLLLMLLSEWGAVMTAVALSAAILLFVRLVKTVRLGVRHPTLNISLFATLVTLVGASMIQGMVIGPFQQMLIVLICGWSLSVFNPQAFSLISGRALMLSAIKYLAAFAVCAFIVLWGVKKDLVLQKELLVSPEGVVNLSYSPRFWADGHDHCGVL